MGNEKNKTTLVYIDTCLPDYFSGFHNPVIQVPVTDKITRKELVTDIIAEISMCWELYEDWLPTDDSELERMVKDIFPTVEADDSLVYLVPFAAWDTSDNDEDIVDNDSTYVFFGLKNETIEEELSK